MHAALKRLRGAFALVYLFEGEENLLIGAREGAPLAVGYGEGEMYLGSDALALAPFTDRVAYLKDGDWVVVTREGADIRDALGRPVKRLREARFAVAKDIKERDLFLASQGISGMSDDDLMYAGDLPLDLEHGLLSYTWPDAGRQDCPFPDYGVTLDDVSNPSSTITSLSRLVRLPTARIVFDTGETPSYYAQPIQHFRPISYIMWELIDSSYMRHYKTVSAVQSWTNSYVNTLGSQVDIWEIGNEINGNWLSRQSNGADVMPKIEAMFDIVYGRGGATALTFFYEGEPSDPNNCIATNYGGNDMFTWITQQFQLNLPPAQRSAETEKIRLNVNYVLISWYPGQCLGENPNWPWVFDQLANIFPNSKVGFGELGTANPEYGSSLELNEMNQYYPMPKMVSGLPARYVGGYFWWYFAEELVPWPGSLGAVLNAALAVGP